MRQELIDAYTILLKLSVNERDPKTRRNYDNARAILVKEMTEKEWECCLRQNGC